MTDTIAVLALDAADYRLAKRWNCQNILLNADDSFETYANARDYPHTLEVWTTVATGLPPEEHSVSGDVQEWKNPLLRAASTVTQYFPQDYRRALGRPFRRRGEDQSFTRANGNHVFDTVFTWPGITPAQHLDEAWTWTDLARQDELSASELRENIRTNTGQEFGWLVAKVQGDHRVVGVHSHALDVAGHVYAKRPEKLRETYEWVDTQLGWVREQIDQLIILSDHGMQTTATDDADPGEHSWEALAATQGIAAPLPDSVYDVREWLEQQRSQEGRERAAESVGMDTTRETLADLGYIET